MSSKRKRAKQRNPRQAHGRSNGRNNGRTKAANLVPWVRSESEALTKVAKLVTKELKKLDEQQSTSRIHKARVALRHWFALWETLQTDGWETKQFKKTVNIPLQELLSKLGDVRDVEVNLEIGTQLACPKSMIKVWKAQKKSAKAELKDFLADFDMKKRLNKIKRFVRKEPHLVSGQVKHSHLAHEPAQEHLLHILDKQERLSQKLAESPNTPDEFHHLRLSLKQWRYLLEDVFNSSNKQLEKSQDILGKMHDLDRMRPLFLGDEKLICALANLNESHRKLIEDFDQLRDKLPFGFRPQLK